MQGPTVLSVGRFGFKGALFVGIRLLPEPAQNSDSGINFLRNKNSPWQLVQLISAASEQGSLTDL